MDVTLAPGDWLLCDTLCCDQIVRHQGLNIKPIKLLDKGFIAQIVFVVSDGRRMPMANGLIPYWKHNASITEPKEIKRRLYFPFA